MRGSSLNDPCWGSRESAEPDHDADEAEAVAAEERAIAQEAGTCCTDPTPAIDDGLVGAAENDPPGCPGAPERIYYCQACDAEMSADRQAMLMADLPGIRDRIARIRATRRAGGCHMSNEQNVSLGILRSAREAAEKMIDDGRAIERKGQEALREVASAELRRRTRKADGRCARCGGAMGGYFLTAEDGAPEHQQCPREPPPEPPERRTCNKHDDCDAADASAKATGRAAPYHCHADDCEECFGC